MRELFGSRIATLVALTMCLLSIGSALGIASQYMVSHPRVSTSYHTTNSGDH